MQLELFNRDQEVRLLIDWAIECALVGNPRPRKGSTKFSKPLIRQVLRHYLELLEAGLSEPHARYGATTHYPDAASLEHAVEEQGGADSSERHEAALELCREALDWLKKAKGVEFDPQQFERTRIEPKTDD